MLPESCAFGIKEWAIVVEAIRTGKQCYLLKKGGLVEPDHPDFDRPGGVFGLIPTWSRQSPDLLRAESTREFSESDPSEAVELEFSLTWAVLANPQVDILGHMFGMCFRRFMVTPPDDKICALISRAAEFGVAVEINSHYHPNARKMIQWCRDFNALITFGSNAHTLESVGAVMRLLDQEVGNV